MIELRHLRRFIRTLNKPAKLLPNRSHNKIVKSLLSYVDVQVSRLITYTPNGPTDLVALATRNLIEISLLSYFVTRNKDNMRRFRKEVYVDLYELFKTLDKSGDRYAELARQVEALDVASNKRIDLSKERPGDKFWSKLCSKHIHPSAWSLNTRGSKSQAKDHRTSIAAYGKEAAIRTIANMTNLPLPPRMKE